MFADKIQNENECNSFVWMAWIFLLSGVGTETEIEKEYELFVLWPWEAILHMDAEKHYKT